VWGIEGLHLMETTGQMITEKTGEKRSTSSLLQRMSVALQRGNVASILGALSPGKKLEEI